MHRSISVAVLLAACTIAVSAQATATSAIAVQSPANNTSVPLTPGAHLVVIQSWDNAGKFTKSSSLHVNAVAPPASITIQSPPNNGTVQTAMSVVASAAGPNPIVALQVYLDNVLKTTVSSSSMNVSVTVSAGAHTVVVQSWDSAGTYRKKSVNVSAVTSSAPRPVEHYVALSWQASASAIMGYNIYRATTTSGPFSRLNSTAEAATTYTDYTVAAGKTFYYAVTSVDAAGESAKSNLVLATIPSP
jgi:LysM repeat protein